MEQLPGALPTGNGPEGVSAQRESSSASFQRIEDLVRESPYSIHAISKVSCRANKIQGDGVYTQRKKERRSYSGKKSFPLIAKGGCLVGKDRRSIPDRRLGDIHLELIDAVDHRFSEYRPNTTLHQEK